MRVQTVSKTKTPSKMSNFEHIVNAYNRQSEEKKDYLMVKNGGVNTEDYIVVHGENAYNVTVENKVVVGCNCPHFTYRKSQGAICKHMVHIATIKRLDLKIPAPKEDEKVNVM